MSFRLYAAFLATCIVMAIVLLVGTVPASAETGQSCIATDNANQATCLTMIGAVRELMESGSNKDTACAATSSNDVAITNNIIDWIRARPERAGDDLGGLIREALISVDPCAQGPLMPQITEPDDLDVE